MAIRKLFKSIVKKIDPVPSEKDRKRSYTAEDYYNAKYPKLNITFPRYELDAKNIRDSADTAFSIYHCDVRSILNTKNFRLPLFEGKTDDERALKVIAWAMDPVLAGLVPATALLEEKMKAGALIYLSDEETTAWNRSNLNKLNNDWMHAVLNGEEVDILLLLRKQQEIVNEYWSYSYQTFIRGYGDCEDGAILMYDVLRKAGIPAWKLRINVGYVNNPDGSPKITPAGRDGGHAWLTYYVESQFWKGKNREDKWVVLDWCNGKKYVGDITTPLDEREKWSADIYDTDLMFSFNEEYCWSTSNNGKLEFGGLFHIEGCPVLSGEIELPAEMKAALKTLGMQEQLFKQEYANDTLCTCKIDT
tara:strand:+ start:202 stop:1284 length:1083 start_codon:yes stop_codon:yes gene_type:complete